MTTRRDVLRLGGGLTAAGLAEALLVGPAAARPQLATPTTTGNTPDAAAWRELRRRLGPGAGLYRPEPGPENGEYGRLAPPDNLRYAHIEPAGIVACATPRDVQTAVRWAVDHGVPLAPRSGGHNYAGHSTTRGLLIHLRRMRAVTVSGERRLTVGGGATNSDVYEARAANLYFPGGRCPGVGVAGLTLGGGLGFNDRKWGLSCDRLLSTDVVLADGSLVRADARENTDLFWACRGGAGGNFGINTGFVYDSVPVAGLRATVFDLTFPLERALAVTEALQDLLAHDHAGDFDVRVGFSHPGTTPKDAAVMTVLGQRLGGERHLRKLLGRVLGLKPTRKVVEELPFWEAQDRLMDRDPATAMASKSLVPTVWLPPSTVQYIIDAVHDWRPGPGGGSGYVTLFAMGARSNDPAPDDTAFPHRAATWVIDIGTAWKPGTPDAEVRDLIHQTAVIHHALRHQLGTSAAYVNFPDPDLRHWQTAYYGDNHDRLATIKEHYDPHRVFDYPQAVGTSG
ncbi:FAD-binding oxidoreductase [Streptomyces tailanensis]|uniref:FAD-binding oxidoreductase n=1 Tax=Streptomyces tailanensis TaxID=2569858 RepID=UPI00155B2C72|nr:FAD-binding oxidoreductase [Streptomyces tailanensis]